MFNVNQHVKTTVLTDDQIDAWIEIQHQGAMNDCDDEIKRKFRDSIEGQRADIRTFFGNNSARCHIIKAENWRGIGRYTIAFDDDQYLGMWLWECFIEVPVDSSKRQLKVMDV